MNRKKANAGMIAIGNLIKENPYITKYDPKAGKVHRNIISPTISSLEALSDMFFFNNINKLREQKGILRFLAFKLEYTPIDYPNIEIAKA